MRPITAADRHRHVFHTPTHAWCGRVRAYQNGHILASTTDEPTEAAAHAALDYQLARLDGQRVIPGLEPDCSTAARQGRLI